MKAAPSIIAALSLLTLCSCDKLRDAGTRIAGGIESVKAGTSGGGVVSEIGAEDFDSFRSRRDKVVIVDFHAPWCGPCRQLAPLLEKIAANYQDEVVVGKINVDNHGEIAAREGVRDIPDMRIYRNGVLVDKLVGLPPESVLRERVEAQIAALAAAETSETAQDTTAEKQPEIGPMSGDWMPPGMQRR